MRTVCVCVGVCVGIVCAQVGGVVDGRVHREKARECVCVVSGYRVCVWWVGGYHVCGWGGVGVVFEHVGGWLAG